MACDILVVDDDPVIRDSLYDLLADAGFAVRVAVNGVEALRVIEAEPPKAILLDLMMPQLDGWETAQALRSRPSTRTLPIIAMTASPNEPTPPGCNGILAKPFTLDRVILALNRFVEVVRAPRRQPTPAV